MPRTTWTRRCPRCGAPAEAAWDQTMAAGVDHPVREDVTSFDTPAGRELPFGKSSGPPGPPDRTAAPVGRGLRCDVAGARRNTRSDVR